MSQRHASTPRSDPDAGELSSGVVRYYDEKTARIIAKYGPGPRIHFHTGLDADLPQLGASQDELRAASVRAQEALLAHLRPALRVGSDAAILDVGCGLGGGALYWAEALRAKVTAITIVPEHVRLVAGFAALAGVGDRVAALCRDAHDLQGLGPFDAAVAVESSCYFDRDAWFATLKGALRPRGEIHIVDCFLGHAGAAERFDGYWRTRVGTLGEYEGAARRAGFEGSVFEELNEGALAFWSLSRAWTRGELAVATSEGERARLRRSIEEHAWLEGALRGREIRYLHVAFAST